MKIYKPAAQIIEHALLEYEEHPDQFIPTPYATIEDNINNIPPELDFTDDRYSFLISSENTDNKYDLNEDLKISKHNYIDSVQTKPNILDNTAIHTLNKLLQHKTIQILPLYHATANAQ